MASESSSSSLVDYNKEIVNLKDDVISDTYKCLFDYLSKSHDKAILGNTIKSMLYNTIEGSVVSQKLRLLLKAIPDINNPAYGAFEILCRAILISNVVIIFEFHKAGFDFNKKNPSTHKMLIDYAVSTRNEIVIEALLRHGAKPSNVCYGKNHTTIGYACSIQCNTKIISMLLEHGADPNVVNNHAPYPFVTVIRSKNRDMINAFMPHMSFSNSAHSDVYKQEAAIAGDLETLKAICAAHKFETHVNEILLSTKYRQLEILEFLLQNTPNTATSNDYILTALNYACVMGYIDVVKVFLKYNVPIDVKNKYGFLPIYYAMSNEQHAIVELLESHNTTPKE